ncbi:hypothetical protein LINPERPRIM_LOCUS32866 [Linum perenne]
MGSGDLESGMSARLSDGCRSYF